MATNPNMPEKSRTLVKELKNMLRKDTFLPTDLLEYRKLFTKFGQFNKF